MVIDILGPEMLNDPQVQELLNDKSLASSLYIVLTEFGKAKPGYWQSQKKIKPEISLARVFANGKIELRFNTDIVTTPTIKKMFAKMITNQATEHQIRNLKKSKTLTPLNLKVIQKKNSAYSD